jgi:hypothetical protein
VVNGDFEEALANLAVLFRAHRLRLEAQQVRHRALIESLLA